MGSSKKPLVFYSHFCEYSKTVLNVLVKKGIREEVMLVNVDKYSHMIPPMVTKVPTILAPDGSVYEDDHLMQYIETLASKLRPVDITPFFSKEMAGGLSDGYSYLDDFNTMSDGVERNFSLVSSYQSIQTPKEEDYSSRNSDIDKFISERETDIKRIISSGGNGGSEYQAQRNFIR